jgi:peptide/nickel transport system permease protein
MMHDRGARWGALTLLTLVAVATIGPILLGVDPRAQPDPVGLALRPPSAAAWLGTDALSRDVLARLLVGTRVSLGIAALAALVAFALGTAWGMVAGWRRGWIDSLMMRFVDVMLAIPRVLLLLLILGFWSDRSPLTLGLVLGATGWMATSRLVRSDVRATLTAPWVVAARALGASDARILRVHILPVAMGQASVAAALAASHALMLEAGLAAIGLGIEMPRSSWGTMLASAVTDASWSWWLLAAPGVPLLAASAAFTAIADAARHAADPRLEDAR